MCNEGNGNNLWSINTNPQLPSYYWLHDTSENIFGEVILTATINDGDIISAKLPVSVEECTALYLSNQTYASNTIKEGCYITLEGINIQNNAKLILNSEMGVLIEKDFIMSVGSQLEMN